MTSSKIWASFLYLGGVERKDNNYLFDSGNLSEGALAKKHRLENAPSSRTNIMEYLPGMEVIQ